MKTLEWFIEHIGQMVDTAQGSVYVRDREHAQRLYDTQNGTEQEDDDDDDNSLSGGLGESLGSDSGSSSGDSGFGGFGGGSFAGGGAEDTW